MIQLEGTSFSTVWKRSVAYGASGNGTPMWVTVGTIGTSNGNIMYSYDGISWSDSVGGNSFSAYGLGVAYGTSRERNSDVGGYWKVTLVMETSCTVTME